MKKLLIMLLVLALAFMMFGCGGSSESEEPAAPDTTEEETTEPETSEGDAEQSEGATDSDIGLKEVDYSLDVVSDVTKDDALYEMLPDYVKEAGKISNGLDDAYPPMSYRTNDNTLVGWDVDYGNAIANKLGITIEWVPADFAGIITGVQTGKMDIALSALTVTEERAEMIDFSDDYFWSGASVIIREESKDEIKSVEDLAGKTIAVQLGSSSETKVGELDYITDVKTYSTITDELMDLKNGRVDAVVEGLPVAMYYSGHTDGITTVDTINSYPYGVAFNKDEDGQKLREAWNAAMKALEEDGTLDKITQKWFGADYDDGHFGMPH